MMGVIALHDVSQRVTRGSFRRFGFIDPTLKLRWREIVCEPFGSRTVPVRIAWPRRSTAGLNAVGRGGTLVVRTDPEGALELTYQREILLARVNEFLGNDSIVRILIQSDPYFKPVFSDDGSSRISNVSSIGDSSTRPLDRSLNLLWENWRRVHGNDTIDFNDESDDDQ